MNTFCETKLHRTEASNASHMQLSMSLEHSFGAQCTFCSCSDVRLLPGGIVVFLSWQYLLCKLLAGRLLCELLAGRLAGSSRSCTVASPFWSHIRALLCRKVVGAQLTWLGLLIKWKPHSIRKTNHICSIQLSGLIRFAMPVGVRLLPGGKLPQLHRREAFKASHRQLSMSLKHPFGAWFIDRSTPCN